MRGVAGAVAAALLLAVAGGAAGALINGYERHGADFCNCPTTEQAVCGTDQQTYLNECVMSCINAIKLKDGPCDPTCYPPRNQFDGGDWESRQAVCASGITYTNKAEAQYDGYAEQCIKDGVCTYVRVNGKDISYEPTTGGKGKSWQDAAANTQFPNKASGAGYAYNEALTKALLYYDSQISGMINTPGGNYKRLAWRDNSCFDCTGQYGEDLSGGYYESGGSGLKLGAISGYTPAFLATSALCFPDGYEKTGLSDDIKFKVKWGADFLINSHVEPYVFMGSMGNNTEDFDMYAPVELYEKYAPKRIMGYCTVDQPCSEITGDAAAALAAASMLLKDDNPEWATSALGHARQLYAFATEYPASYMDVNDNGALEIHRYFYTSYNGFKDELAFAAAMLYKATGEERYKADAERYFDEAEYSNTQEVGALKPITAVLMAQLDPGNQKYFAEARRYFDEYLEGQVTHTDCGSAQPYHWGGLTHGSNVATLGFCHAKNQAVDRDYAARLFNYGQHQVDYVLGDCGRSWLVGFGEKYPQYLHQEFSYNSILVWRNESDPLGVRIPATMQLGPLTVEKTGRPQRWMKAMLDFFGNYYPARHIAYGTLFGAPLLNDGLVLSRRDYTYTEPTIVYNSAITGALAGLAEYYGQGPWSGELKEVNDVDYRPYLLKM